MNDSPASAFTPWPPTVSPLEVDTVVGSPSFARLQVTDPLSEVSAKVELGIDWRQDPPTQLPIGPVLSADDAVANKVTALYSRAQARDYMDVDAAVMSGRYTRPDLLRLAAEHDPGFDPAMFAVALRAIRRLPATEFGAYGLSPEQTLSLTERITGWADEIMGTDPRACH